MCAWGPLRLVGARRHRVVFLCKRAACCSCRVAFRWYMLLVRSCMDLTVRGSMLNCCLHGRRLYLGL